MIAEKVLQALEYDKVLTEVAKYAVLQRGKSAVLQTRPLSEISSVKILNDKTAEAVKLLFVYNVSQIPFAADISEIIERAKVGGTLNFGELLNIAAALRSARIVKTSVLNVKDDSIVLLCELAERLFTDQPLENEINEKIVSEDAMADSASFKLAAIRKQIRTINARIRDKLNSYIRGANKYLQDNIITVRGDRYVIPVRAEFRGSVKGFVHDQSASGATVFIEPEQIIEYNNELKTAMIEEANEIRRILQELSAKVAAIAQNLVWNAENLTEIDVIYAKASYSYNNRCVYPSVNDAGEIDILKGRHPLIAADKVVPVTVKLGGSYKFLLITGPNTGGKTVTLKLTGLLTAMMMSGIFVPCGEESKLSVFNDIFCDIGDEQSIEQSLSTFSSHMKNIIDILNRVTDKALVLLDEIGAGTDPEEGSGLALAVIEALLDANCCGIITTHYSKLKEYAFGNDKIENASMDFDTKTFAPLYKLNIGIPGSSNAIEISKRLGLSENIAKNALSFLSDTKISFENILKQAEESRNNADKLTRELELIEHEKRAELNEIKEERARLEYELERISQNVKAETRRQVNERLEEAEELLEQIKELAKKESFSGTDVITARNLKNRLEDKRYVSEDRPQEKLFDMKRAKFEDLRTGERIYSQKLGAEAEIVKLLPQKRQAEIRMGVMTTIVPESDIYTLKRFEKAEKAAVKVNKKVERSAPQAEINVLGQTVLEGVANVEAFLDQAVVNGLEEVKIIHGVGTGKLRAGIWENLRKNKNIKEYRSGRYGEGEKGVTIITLK
ncbi:MAG: endonuclease MutS2 [Bacillota bacterium]|nr:MAG: endonuclease MutS2 [Bacillota bacterium]